MYCMNGKRSQVIQFWEFITIVQLNEYTPTTVINFIFNFYINNIT